MYLNFVDFVVDYDGVVNVGVLVDDVENGVVVDDDVVGSLEDDGFDLNEKVDLHRVSVNDPFVFPK